MQAMGKLAGKTIFITGASRGIGKAIALRCAEDGANIVVAAKTVTPHPKLSGTIYTAAEEIEKAGGKSLPCVVDIQSEDQVQKAVDETVSKFGGIDILINNASAISLTNTEMTPMKRYDLMNGINARGTFLCSKLCLPHLKQSKNPHILNISPPLSMKAKWFKNHVAYTMAKYGMSLCVLGMADEFREDGVAVNALWPRTAIYTAAMEMLGGGSGVKNQCRSPDIMSDAAYSILTRDSRQCTGNFLIDDEVLKADGVTDLSKYQYDPSATLLPDFFLEDDDVDPEAIKNLKGSSSSSSSSSSSPGSAAPSGSPDLKQTLKLIEAQLNPDLVSSIGGVFQFDFKDDGEYYLDLKNGSGALGSGKFSGDADVMMTTSAETFVSMSQGKVNPTTAFMGGKLKIKGNLGLATKLEKVMKSVHAKL